ncbi:hypothetical protein J5X07_07780 [Actinomyces bowdenii]|uniref:hypothetical protein n=1 Tax=Actinomyces bowdenii TaxID=131109 RepID=UPI001ABBE6D7|nr:hypothetical protein [Actinomyces bowdenii]MBO3724924.1 hypothetical protein [Actinomyces bowdenii]
MRISFRKTNDEELGTGFIHLRDSGQMRVTFLWEAEVPDGWEATFGQDTCWKEGAVNLRARGRRGHMITAWHRWRAGYFHPEVSQRILDAGNRRSLALKRLFTYDAEDGYGAVLEIGALEVLRVAEEDNSCTVILATHAAVPNVIYERYYEAAVKLRSLERLGDFLTRMLADPKVCADHPVILASDRQGRERWIAPPLFTVTWVPLSFTTSWLPEDEKDVTSLVERQGAPISMEVANVLLSCPHSIATPDDHDCHDCRVSQSLAAVSGWQWSELPSPTGLELGEEAYAEAIRRTHLLSQSQAITVGETGVAYMARQNDDFLCEGMLRSLSTDLDVYFLVVLDRLRIRALSKKIAETAKEVSAHIGRHGGTRVLLDDLDGLIDTSVRLDSDAVTFLVSEWWTDVSGHTRADRILTWMHDVTKLDEAVAQVVEQARLLRESIQTLIEREEHRVDLERQDIERQRQAIEREQQESSRMMEWALGVLAFIGIPLSVLLEIWINWDPGTGLWGRHWLWWLSLNGVIVGAVGIGLGLAKFFHVRIGRPPRGLSPAKEPEMPSRAEPKRIPPPPQATPHEDDPQEPPTQKKE